MVRQKSPVDDGSTYQSDDGVLKDLYRATLAAGRVTEHQEYQHIGGSQHDTCPERKLRK